MTRRMLAELPDPNQLVAFDRNRRVMVTMAQCAGAVEANDPQTPGHRHPLPCRISVLRSDQHEIPTQLRDWVPVWR